MFFSSLCFYEALVHYFYVSLSRLLTPRLLPISLPLYIHHGGQILLSRGLILVFTSLFFFFSFFLGVFFFLSDMLNFTCNNLFYSLPLFFSSLHNFDEAKNYYSFDVIYLSYLSYLPYLSLRNSNLSVWQLYFQYFFLFILIIT